MNVPSDALSPAARWFAAYSIRCPSRQTRRSQGETRSQLHPANSEFPAEATSLLDHEIGPASAHHSGTRPSFVESKPTDNRQRTIQDFPANSLALARSRG